MLKKLLFITFVAMTLIMIGCSEEVTKPKSDVADPVFTPQTGNFDDTVIVTISCATDEAIIRYTLDNSDPTESSQQYTAPFEVSTTTTVKAKAYRDGWNPSAVTTARYTIVRTVATPVFIPTEGTFSDNIEVTITCETDDVIIYYTTDNREPNIFSPQYEEPLLIDKTTTIKAYAAKEGWINSQVVTANYGFVLPNLMLDPPPAVYYEPPTISILFDIETLSDIERIDGARIYYTTNGAAPTQNSLLYTEPIHLTNDTTIKAKAFKDGWSTSNEVGGFYELDLPVVVNPTFEPRPGTFFGSVIVTITSSIPDVDIHISLNGQDPDQNSPLYSSPIEITSTTTVKVKAYKEDWYPSEVVSALYTISETQIQMISVPGGTFQMGDTNDIGEFDELPVHQITISPFQIGRNLVRQSEWTLVMGNNPSGFTGNNRPVENVSWYDAVMFCNKLSIMSNLTPVYSVFNDTNPDHWEKPFVPDVDWNANGYRLPTEAEWEYAARGGTNDPDHRYSGSNVIEDVAWYEGNSPSGTLPVGIKAGNGLAIFDMSGNVWEWCGDWYSSGYYSISPTNNPKGPDEGTTRVRRGGGWNSPAASCRIANRSAVFPAGTGNNSGFRIAKTVN